LHYIHCSSCLAIIIGFGLGSFSEASVYTGAISNHGGGLATLGRWDADPNPVAASLTWTVSDNMDGTWHYQYIFRHNRGATSHLLIEVSPNVVATDILNEVVLADGANYTGFTVIQGPGGAPSNPNIPGTMTNSIKFDILAGVVTQIDFDIARLPTWGDFYAKDGGGNPKDQAWNTGFTAVDFDPPTDPLVNPHYPLQDGPLVLNGLYHILVPDSVVPQTQTESAPEPAAVVVWSLLVAAVAVYRYGRFPSFA
jgi:hypothetical protein